MHTCARSRVRARHVTPFADGSDFVRIDDVCGGGGAEGMGGRFSPISRLLAALSANAAARDVARVTAARRGGLTGEPRSLSPRGGGTHP